MKSYDELKAEMETINSRWRKQRRTNVLNALEEVKESLQRVWALRLGC